MANVVIGEILTTVYERSEPVTFEMIESGLLWEAKKTWQEDRPAVGVVVCDVAWVKPLIF